MEQRLLSVATTLGDGSTRYLILSPFAAQPAARRVGLHHDFAAQQFVMRLSNEPGNLAALRRLAQQVLPGSDYWADHDRLLRLAHLIACDALRVFQLPSVSFGSSLEVPDRPDNPDDPPDSPARRFVTIEWVEETTWCSEPATLRGTTQSYNDGDTESADVRNASNGAVLRAQRLTIRGNAYRQPFDMINVLPSRSGANFVAEMMLDALAVGKTTPRPLRLRFIPTLTLTACTIGRAHFDMSVTNYEALIGGTINYVPGWIQFIIQLGATVPAGTGGNCGVNFGNNPGSFGGTDWRYAKRNPTTGGLVYWNGTAWTAVPATWADPLNILLYPIAIWVEGGTNRTQFGTLAWPEAIPAWGATETSLATTTLATWTTNINATWTRKFDLKRRECRSTNAQCCRYKVRCRVQFVQVATRGTGIVLAANNARSNAGVWSLGDNRAGMPPHEFGHHLGNPDEYAGGVGIDTSVNTDGATAGIDANSIMGANLSTVKRRHFKTICQHMAAMVSAQAGRSYHYDAVPVV